jgi:hypothetical protein
MLEQHRCEERRDLAATASRFPAGSFSLQLLADVAPTRGRFFDPNQMLT